METNHDENQIYDDEEYFEDFKSKPNVVDFAYQIVDMDKEVRQLRRENKELREELTSSKNSLDRSYKASQETVGTWMNALIGGEFEYKKHKDAKS